MYEINDAGKFKWKPDFSSDTRWKVQSSYMKGFDISLSAWIRDGWSLYAAIPRILNEGRTEMLSCDFVLYKEDVKP